MVKGFRLVRKGGNVFLVPREVSIEKYPFAYRRDFQKDLLGVDDLVMELPKKPRRKDVEERWRSLYKQRRKELGEERGYAEVETKSIGKENYKWDWTPGLRGFRTDVIGSFLYLRRRKEV